MILDNHAGRPGPIGTHFQFRVRGRRIVYCRIRKNGCSSFQNFILGTSPHRSDPERASGFRFLRQHHAVPSQSAIESADCRILVYRDPVERMRSLYLNKFVQKKDAVDILRSYRAVTGRDPASARFEDFVFDYASRLGEVRLDPHVWPQSWHVTNVLYDEVFALSDLHTEMARLIGPRRADRFFLHRLNPSKAAPFDIGGELRQRIEQIYAEDIAMIARLAPGPASETAAQDPVLAATPVG